ncbi:HNH endonuclease [Rhodococcus sp. D2-41]|uniref:hypothetical protein n=1 Tax=Speluncibacter jeojiensis TaxID=2710754 RepID=UPI00241027ED|nr:hypothetical protein [Rhodococcus sp. D2-41]MDG3012172.1 HNH endonuclease [Rhodococcus sp. D2-41]
MSRRKTGPSQDQVDALLARSGGDCEVIAGPACLLTAHQIHHRRARGMGGTKRDSTNFPSGLLHVCWVCHAHIESNRERALRAGWLVSQNDEPAHVPVRWRGRQVLLTDLGGIVEQEVLW